MISHLGIALFLLAILLTFSQKDIISRNTSGYNLGSSFAPNENLLLMKDEILPMGSYFVTYKGNERVGEDIIYTIDFLRKNADGEYYKVFESSPTIKLNETMGNVYNPHSKIYLSKDIFTYITFADVDAQGVVNEPTLLGKFSMSRNDTISFDHNKFVLSQIDAEDNSGDAGNDISIEASIDVITHFNKKYTVKPRFLLKENIAQFEDAALRDLDYRFRFSEVGDEPFTIGVELYRDKPEFIIIKTIIFPYINLLWISCIVMLVGFWMTYRRRWKRRGND